jgi:hypothetical protein
MSNTNTTKDLLEAILGLQKSQSKDIDEIKKCLKGDDYHPEGLLHQVEQNRKCIDDIKRNRLPALEKELEKRTGIIGGIIGFVTVVGTTVLNWLLWAKGITS